MIYTTLTVLLAHRPGDNWTAQAEVFEEIFFVFMVLGTLVGAVVISYTLYNAYKYRDTKDRETDWEPPKLGELPRGGGKGKKVFVSFGISAVIVISLVVYGYGLLLYVESGPDGSGLVEDESDVIEVHVVAYQFGWEFQYPNGESVDGELRVPENTVVRLTITSRDVWHNFGISELRVKDDAIPGQNSTTWFTSGQAGETYRVECYELCGAGHSFMTGKVIVMEQQKFDDWYQNMGKEGEGSGSGSGNETDGAGNESGAGNETGAGNESGGGNETGGNGTTGNGSGTETSHRIVAEVPA